MQWFAAFPTYHSLLSNSLNTTHAQDESILKEYTMPSNTFTRHVPRASTFGGLHHVRNWNLSRCQLPSVMNMTYFARNDSSIMLSMPTA
jgi:hypothetical protein